MSKDLRQSKPWANYLQSIGWKIVNQKHCQIFIRKIPFLPFSVIKIQRAKNPLPFIFLDQLANEHRALFINIEPDLDQFDEHSFYLHGYQSSSMFLSHTKTILINLTNSDDSLWKNLSENARRNIKKSQNSNLKTQILLGDLENFQKFYQLFKNLTHIKKFYIPTYNELFKKFQAFSDHSIFLIAESNRQPIAGIWLAYFDDCAVYMHTGITNEGYKKLANYLLVWEAIKTAKKLGCKTFDFEGIYDDRFPKERKRWTGFSEFKSRFHGQVIEYPKSMIKFYSLWFKILSKCSQILPQ